jgi:hypothetical protein
MRSAVWLVTAALLVLAGVMWWSEAPPVLRRTATSAPKLKPAPLVTQKKGPVTVPGNYSWKDASEKELRGIVSEVKERNAVTGFKMESLVASGESIIANAYEGRPGEFVFNKLTPTVKTRDDGTNVVAVEVNSFSVTVSGEQRELYSNFDKSHELEPGNVYSMTDLVDDGGYSLSITIAQIVGNGQSVRLSASGEWKVNATEPGNDDNVDGVAR